MTGFINFYKPSGMSSAYSLVKIKKLLGKKVKCGHMGTLDPLASGVLPVAIGKATRLFDYLLDKVKVYEAEFTFGFETDTLDLGGKTIKEGGRVPSLDEVRAAARKQVGAIEQIPPAFSAKNVNGKRSYELARSGVTVELKPKTVEILSIEVSGGDSAGAYNFKITCKGGTYIRSVCRDVAQSLGTVATMTKLARVKSGIFDINSAVRVDDLTAENLSDYLILPENVLDFDRITINDKEYADLLNGKSINFSGEDGLYVCLYGGKAIGALLAEAGAAKMKTYIGE